MRDSPRLLNILLTIVRSDALSVQPFARIIIQVADENVDRSRSSRVLAVRSASWALFGSGFLLSTRQTG
jgi:hypothetical protein